MKRRDAKATLEVKLPKKGALLTVLEILRGFDLVGLISDWKPYITNHEYKTQPNSSELEDYWKRKKVFQTPTEIVEVLKVLIFHDEVQDPQVYDGFICMLLKLAILSETLAGRNKEAWRAENLELLEGMGLTTWNSWKFDTYAYAAILMSYVFPPSMLHHLKFSTTINAWQVARV
ncbi:hypothetical protein RIF29_09525 [Crotalaria pallida]|uniref:Uncharacterized protein n=1 Tax=Crotalaria pallida TaxID=3830 RepID=A0AAN9IJP2_CROPI